MATTVTQANGTSAKQGNLNKNGDPKKPLMFEEYTEHSETDYYSDFEREVPGHGQLTFRLIQNLTCLDGKKRVVVSVRCLDLDWSQIDDARIRVLVRVGDVSFAINQMLASDGDMVGLVYFTDLTEDGTIDDDVFCSIEESTNDVGWNRFREIKSKPATFGGGAANHNQIADGVPYKLECSCATLLSLLGWIYLGEIPAEHVCGVIRVADSLQMSVVVHDMIKFMREELDNQAWSFEHLLEWYGCASQYALDGGKLEGEILKRLAVLSGDDQEKKDLLKQQIEVKNQIKSNPKIVAAMAFESLFK